MSAETLGQAGIQDCFMDGGPGSSLSEMGSSLPVSVVFDHEQRLAVCPTDARLCSHSGTAGKPNRKEECHTFPPVVTILLMVRGSGLRQGHCSLYYPHS